MLRQEMEAENEWVMLAEMLVEMFRETRKLFVAVGKNVSDHLDMLTSVMTSYVFLDCANNTQISESKEISSRRRR